MLLKKKKKRSYRMLLTRHPETSYDLMRFRTLMRMSKGILLFWVQNLQQTVHGDRYKIKASGEL